MTSNRLTLREISLFFFPLLLNVQMMSVSHSIINGALARLPDYVTALASFSVAMVVHTFLASPSYQNHTLTIAVVRGNASLRGAVIFVLLVAGWVSVVLGLIAWTPLGTLVLKHLLGTSDEVAKEARSVLGFLALLPLFTGFRGLFQGLVIRARRTSLVSFATSVRIGALFAALALGSRWFSGPALGAFGLMSCVALETVLVAFFAWRTELPKAAEGEKTTAEILWFGFPLAYSSCLQQTVPLLITAIVARMADAEPALAAFGVIRGLLFLLSGPMRNLQQAYLTLVRDGEDYQILLQFFYRISAAMGLLTLLAAYPMNELILGRIMGLEPELRQYVALPLAACALFPLIYGASNLLRGHFSGAGQTARLGHSVILKNLFLLLCWALVSLLPRPLPGIAVAIFLLIVSELCEALYLFGQKRRPASASTSLWPS